MRSADLNALMLIPARGGSKGLPGKNILPLGGRPLIHHTIIAAREVAVDDDICVSTDSTDIADFVMEVGLHVPFMRPAQFATDTATSEEVIHHALGWYAAQGRSFDWVVLLQPTSPLRTGRHIQEALSLIGDDVDMVVSVFETDANPYYVLVEPDKDGYLTPSKQAAFTRRQDCPVVFQLNGAIYVIRVVALGRSPIKNITRRIPYVMERADSLDIDEAFDLKVAELLMAERDQGTSSDQDGIDR